jgi:hypothetical protein
MKQAEVRAPEGGFTPLQRPTALKLRFHPEIIIGNHYSTRIYHGDSIPQTA